MTVLPFILVSIVAVTFALSLTLSRNAVHGALCLVVNFAAVGVLFLLLSAEFIFIVQIAVYAGAIMVLFLFVIMLLSVKGNEESMADKPKTQVATAVILGALLFGEIALLGTRAKGLVSQTPVKVSEAFGQPQEVGMALYSKYLLPFELTSLILLAAMVGAVVLAKRRLS